MNPALASFFFPRKGGIGILQRNYIYSKLKSLFFLPFSPKAKHSLQNYCTQYFHCLFLYERKHTYCCRKQRKFWLLLFVCFSEILQVQFGGFFAYKMLRFKEQYVSSYNGTISQKEIHQLNTDRLEERLISVMSLLVKTVRCRGLRLAI